MFVLNIKSLRLPSAEGLGLASILMEIDKPTFLQNYREYKEFVKS
jgi:hypothetical protein